MAFSPPFPRRAGFTLVELLFAVSIAAVVLGAALPSLGRLIDDTRMRGAEGAMTLSLNHARIVAITKTTTVSICPSLDGARCTGEADWRSGWIVFLDPDRDGERGDVERVLDVVQAQPASLAIRSEAGRSHVTYRPDGSATGTNLTIAFCDRRGPASARALVVNNAGRVRVEVPPPVAAATTCAAVRA